MLPFVGDGKKLFYQIYIGFRCIANKFIVVSLSHANGVH